jgi:hypothetical protein
MGKINERKYSDLEWDVLIPSGTSEHKVFSIQELTSKILNSILNYKSLKDRIVEFDRNFNYPFLNSLKFHLSRSMVKHCSAIEFINWKIGTKDKMIINDNDNEKTTLETLDIITDFLNEESRVTMQRIRKYCDHEFEGILHNNAPCYDYNIVCPEGQLENYKSLLFYKENYQCVISYYLDFISLFPVTLQEFEIVFFYFLTFLIKEEYPANVQINESLHFIKRINDIVRMRYIDINNRLILAFMHLIYIDDELSECSYAIFNDIKHNDDLIREQFESISS